MGIHITVRNEAGVEHPDWDWIRHVGDRDFPSYTAHLPRVEGPNTAWLEGTFRPVDFAAWRAVLPADRDNFDRFLHLLNLLEADQQWWVDFSY